jgi:hypothetical protein
MALPLWASKIIFDYTNCSSGKSTPRLHILPRQPYHEKINWKVESLPTRGTGPFLSGLFTFAAAIIEKMECLVNTWMKETVNRTKNETTRKSSSGKFTGYSR